MTVNNKVNKPRKRKSYWYTGDGPGPCGCDCPQCDRGYHCGDTSYHFRTDEEYHREWLKKGDPPQEESHDQRDAEPTE